MIPTVSIQNIIDTFFPDSYFVRLEPVGEGLINHTWMLETNRQKWLLQRINTALFRQPAALMENIAAIAKHLQADTNYPLIVAGPLSTTTGANFYEDHKGHCWRVFPFLEGTFAPEYLPSPMQARHAAGAYGAFIRSLGAFPATTLYEPLPGFHDTIARYRQFRAVVAADTAGRQKLALEEIERVFAAEKYAIEVNHLIRTGQLPIRVTHNDTKAGNVLLDKNTQMAVSVIDWDTVMPGTVLSDYGDMVRTFVPDRYEDDPADNLEIRADVLAALKEGFLSATSDFLSKAEIAHLHLGAQWIIGEQALRFLTDYLAGDIYYKIKDKDHNLRRAQNQLALLDKISQ